MVVFMKEHSYFINIAQSRDISASWTFHHRHVTALHSSPDVGQNKIFENGLCGLNPLNCI